MQSALDSTLSESYTDYNNNNSSSNNNNNSNNNTSSSSSHMSSDTQSAAAAAAATATPRKVGSRDHVEKVRGGGLDLLPPLVPSSPFDISTVDASIEAGMVMEADTAVTTECEDNNDNDNDYDNGNDNGNESEEQSTSSSSGVNSRQPPIQLPLNDSIEQQDQPQSVNQSASNALQVPGSRGSSILSFIQQQSRNVTPQSINYDPYTLSEQINDELLKIVDLKDGEILELKKIVADLKDRNVKLENINNNNRRESTNTIKALSEYSDNNTPNPFQTTDGGNINNSDLFNLNLNSTNDGGGEQEEELFAKGPVGGRTGRFALVEQSNNTAAAREQVEVQMISEEFRQFKQELALIASSIRHGNTLPMHILNTTNILSNSGNNSNSVGGNTPVRSTFRRGANINNNDVNINKNSGATNSSNGSGVGLVGKELKEATEVGEALLSIVRNLQIKLNDTESQLSETQNMISRASIEREGLLKQMARLRDGRSLNNEQVWELERSKIEVEGQLKELKNNYSKLMAELNRDKRELRDTHDKLQILTDEKKDLNDVITKIKTRHESDMTTSRGQIAKLQREKTDLSKQLEEVRTELEGRLKRAGHLGDVDKHLNNRRNNKFNDGDDYNSDEDDDVFGSPNNNNINRDLLSPTSPTRRLDGGMATDTLRRSLNFAHLDNEELRNKISQLELENAELIQTIMEHEEVIEHYQREFGIFNLDDTLNNAIDINQGESLANISFDLSNNANNHDNESGSVNNSNGNNSNEEEITPVGQTLGDIFNTHNNSSNNNININNISRTSSRNNSRPASIRSGITGLGIGPVMTSSSITKSVTILPPPSVSQSISQSSSRRTSFIPRDAATNARRTSIGLTPTTSAISKRHSRQPSASATAALAKALSIKEYNNASVQTDEYNDNDSGNSSGSDGGSKVDTGVDARSIHEVPESVTIEVISSDAKETMDTAVDARPISIYTPHHDNAAIDDTTVDDSRPESVSDESTMTAIAPFTTASVAPVETLPLNDITGVVSDENDGETKDENKGGEINVNEPLSNKPIPRKKKTQSNAGVDDDATNNNTRKSILWTSTDMESASSSTARRREFSVYSIGDQISEQKVYSNTGVQTDDVNIVDDINAYNRSRMSYGRRRSEDSTTSRARRTSSAQNKTINEEEDGNESDKSPFDTVESDKQAENSKRGSAVLREIVSFSELSPITLAKSFGNNTNNNNENGNGNGNNNNSVINESEVNVSEDSSPETQFDTLPSRQVTYQTSHQSLASTSSSAASVVYQHVQVSSTASINSHIQPRTPSIRRTVPSTATMAGNINMMTPRAERLLPPTMPVSPGTPSDARSVASSIQNDDDLIGSISHPQAVYRMASNNNNNNNNHSNSNSNMNTGNNNNNNSIVQQPSPYGSFAADPLVVASITRTMIGDYLWKFVSHGSHARTERCHIRYFWLHPYTKTINWGPVPPDSNAAAVRRSNNGNSNGGFGLGFFGLSGAGNGLRQTKSAYIKAVRVVNDHQTSSIHDLPPLSIIITTPTREIKLKAKNRTSHDSWYHALHFLQAKPAITDKVYRQHMGSSSTNTANNNTGNNNNINNGSSNSNNNGNNRGYHSYTVSTSRRMQYPVPSPSTSNLRVGVAGAGMNHGSINTIATNTTPTSSTHPPRSISAGASLSQQRSFAANSMGSADSIGQILSSSNNNNNSNNNNSNNNGNNNGSSNSLSSILKKASRSNIRSLLKVSSFAAFRGNDRPSSSTTSSSTSPSGLDIDQTRTVPATLPSHQSPLTHSS